MKNLPLLIQEYRRLRGLKIPPRQALDLAAFYVPMPWASIGAAAAGIVGAWIFWLVIR